jgi:hypothetical protein
LGGRVCTHHKTHPSLLTWLLLLLLLVVHVWW